MQSNRHMPQQPAMHLNFSSRSQAHIHTFDDLNECASHTIDSLTTGSIALSGGSTFTRLFPLWIGLHPDCRAARFFPVDERVVPISDPSSNWGSACRLLLNPLGKQDDAHHFAASADTYRMILRDHFSDAPPRFDCMFLGIGADGHTASLFPGNEYLSDTASSVLETRSPIAPFNRITLGPGALIAARKLFVIISGEGKQAAVRALMQRDLSLPFVSIIARRSESLIYIEKSLQ
jgi:6-phosphogluconolactonase